MTDRERQRRARQSVESRRIEHERRNDGSFSIDAWCRHRGLSRAMFYELDQQGKAPRTYYVGTRRFISSEADAAWLRAREAESNEAA
jgi:predicted DNA-binding transcriptional regulator AlpA